MAKQPKATHWGYFVVLANVKASVRVWIDYV